MTNAFGGAELSKIASIAAIELRSKPPKDRSFKLGLPDYLTQEWIDDLVLQAHFVAPVWSDYSIVRNRPDIWEMAFYAAFNAEDRLVLVADDSLVVASTKHVEMLITTTPIAGRDAIQYQIGIHSFCMSPEALFFPVGFRGFAQAHGLMSYPDSALIDELGVSQNGNGADEYLAHAERTRPVFIFRRDTLLPIKAKRFQHAAKVFYSGFGPVIVNDGLFKRYSSAPSDRKFGVMAIAPGGEAFHFERDGSIVPSNFQELLDRCEIPAPTAIEKDDAELGSSALSAWSSRFMPPPTLDDLREGGEVFKQKWDDLLRKLAPPSAPSDSSAESEDLDESKFGAVDSSPLPKGKAKQLALDGDGYPIDSSDVVEWATITLPQNIEIIPRARRALSKSRHPDPRRIAQALEILAGPKSRGYLGDPNTTHEFEDGLLKLRMRDGFSNAERLRGQTGADYIIEYNGRKLLLERHLCSNSSAFNDPRMIRIYYVFDRPSEKIVIGWLPSHLRTSQS